MTKSKSMNIYKNLGKTEIKYGYLSWTLENDSNIRELLNDMKYINIIINGRVSYHRNIELDKKRIYLGSDIKNIKCHKVKITITIKNIEITCI